MHSMLRLLAVIPAERGATVLLDVYVLVVQLNEFAANIVCQATLFAAQRSQDMARFRL